MNRCAQILMHTHTAHGNGFHCKIPSILSDKFILMRIKNMIRPQLYTSLLGLMQNYHIRPSDHYKLYTQLNKHWPVSQECTTLVYTNSNQFGIYITEFENYNANRTHFQCLTIRNSILNTKKKIQQLSMNKNNKNTVFKCVCAFIKERIIVSSHLLKSTL